MTNLHRLVFLLLWFESSVADSTTSSTSSTTIFTSGSLPDRWYPVAGFYFLYEVGVEPDTIDDIMTFLANYAACGSAPYEPVYIRTLRPIHLGT